MAQVLSLYIQFVPLMSCHVLLSGPIFSGANDSILPHPLLVESHIREACEPSGRITFASYMIMTIEVFSERKEVSEASTTSTFIRLSAATEKPLLTGAAERPSV